MNISQSLTCIYKGLQVENITRVTITFQEQDTSWSLELQGWMTLKLHHELRKYFIQQYGRYDTILQVEYHILHHFFYPCYQSDFSDCSQITECIKSSATQQRNIHMTSNMTPTLNFFLPQFVVYIMYKLPPKINCLWPQVYGLRHFFENYHHLFHKTSSSYPNHFKPLSESSIYFVLTSATTQVSTTTTTT